MSTATACANDKVASESEVGAYDVKPVATATKNKKAVTVTMAEPFSSSSSNSDGDGDTDLECEEADIDQCSEGDHGHGAVDEPSSASGAMPVPVAMASSISAVMAPDVTGQPVHQCQEPMAPMAPDESATSTRPRKKRARKNETPKEVTEKTALARCDRQRAPAAVVHNLPRTGTSASLWELSTVWVEDLPFIQRTDQKARDPGPFKTTFQCQFSILQRNQSTSKFQGHFLLCEVSSTRH